MLTALAALDRFDERWGALVEYLGSGLDAAA